MKRVGTVPKFGQQNASLMGTGRHHPVPLRFMNWPWPVAPIARNPSNLFRHDAIVQLVVSEGHETDLNGLRLTGLKNMHPFALPQVFCQAFQNL